MIFRLKWVRFYLNLLGICNPTGINVSNANFNITYKPESSSTYLMHAMPTSFPTPNAYQFSRSFPSTKSLTAPPVANTNELLPLITSKTYNSSTLSHSKKDVVANFAEDPPKIFSTKNPSDSLSNSLDKAPNILATHLNLNAVPAPNLKENLKNSSRAELFKSNTTFATLHDLYELRNANVIEEEITSQYSFGNQNAPIGLEHFEQIALEEAQGRENDLLSAFR